MLTVSQRVSMSDFKKKIALNAYVEFRFFSLFRCFSTQCRCLVLLPRRVTGAGCRLLLLLVQETVQKEYSLKNPLGKLHIVEPYLGEEFNAEKFMTSQRLWNKACGRTNKNVSQLLLEGLIVLPLKQATQVTLAVQRQDKVL